MARRRKNNNDTQRDASDIATESEVLRSFIKKSTVVPRPIVLSPPKDLRPLSDRRTWHPEGPARPAPSIQKSRHRLVIPKGTRKHAGRSPSISRSVSDVPKTVAFDDPKRVLVCIRRKTRKQVLFAKRKTGKGARARRRRNYYSGVACV